MKKVFSFLKNLLVSLFSRTEETYTTPELTEPQTELLKKIHDATLESVDEDIVDMFERDFEGVEITDLIVSGKSLITIDDFNRQILRMQEHYSVALIEDRKEVAAKYLTAMRYMNSLCDVINYNEEYPKN